MPANNNKKKICNISNCLFTGVVIRNKSADLPSQKNSKHIVGIRFEPFKRQII